MIKRRLAVFPENTIEIISKLPRKPGAYLLTCPDTGHKYVGVTNNLKRRAGNHLRTAHSKFIGFEFTVLEVTESSDWDCLNELEIKYIQIHSPELNSLKASKYSGK
jgi:excinuclease UvrABC nuclease subunit